MKTILLVEDDPFLIDIYTTKLKEGGFSVEVAAGGEEGLRKLKEKSFDLLVLDIVLPRIDGWKVLEEIKNQKPSPVVTGRGGRREQSSLRSLKDKNLKDLKIIILSNLGQKEEVEKGLKLGAIRYLIKAHYTPSEVVEEIRKILK
jgi:DNA-binding response OmpR family regulator